MRYRVVTRWSPLNVRAGPGLHFRAVTQLPRGQVVEVLQTVQNDDGIWHRVANGWCSWLYLEPVEQATRPIHRGNTPQPQPAFLNLTPPPLAQLQREREKLLDAIELAEQRAYTYGQVAAQHGSRRYQMDEHSRAARDLENLPRALGIEGEDEPGVRGLETAQDVGIARELEREAARYVAEAYHLRRELQRVERDMQFYRQGRHINRNRLVPGPAGYYVQPPNDVRDRTDCQTVRPCGLAIHPTILSAFALRPAPVPKAAACSASRSHRRSIAMLSHRKSLTLFRPFPSSRHRARPRHRPLGLELLEDRTVLTTIVVTTDLDTLIPRDGLTSLREAILLANEMPGLDEIVVPEGVYVLGITGRSGRGEDAGRIGDLDIHDSLRVIGAGSGRTIVTWDDPSRTRIADRVFDVHGGISVQIQGLTITDGFVTDENGGAIRNQAAALTLVDCSINDNSVGSLVRARLIANGGAIANGGTLTIMNCAISNNILGSSGGGIFNSGILVVDGSTISDNFAEDGGGGIHNSIDGMALVQNTTIALGRSRHGSGACILNEGVLEVVGSTIVNGFADDDGAGGIFNAEHGFARVTNSTISGNFGRTAITNAGELTLTNVTIAFNEARGVDVFNSSTGILNLTNTIVARSLLSDGTMVAAKNNLVFLPVGRTSEFLHPSEGNLVGVVARLSPLGDFGGPTSVCMPLADSPVIDAGTDIGAPATDQRGVLRPQDGDLDGTGTIDIGAVEARFPRIFFPLPGAAASLVLRRDGPFVELSDAQNGKILLKEPFNLKGSVDLGGSQEDDSVIVLGDGLEGLPISFVGRDGDDTLMVHLPPDRPRQRPDEILKGLSVAFAGLGGNDALTVNFGRVQAPPVVTQTQTPHVVNFDGGDGGDGDNDAVHLSTSIQDEDIRIEGRQGQAFDPRFEIMVRDIATQFLTAQLSAVHAEALRIDSGGGSDNIGMQVAGGSYRAPLTVDLDSSDGDDQLSIAIDAVFHELGLHLDAGEGNNSMTVQFVEGSTGQVPPIGMSKIRTECRSGAGRDALVVEHIGQLEIDFAFLADLGAGADRLDVRLAPVAVEPPPPNPGDNLQVEPPPPNPGDNPNGPPPGVPTYHLSVDLRTAGGIDVVNMDVAVTPTPCSLVADFGIDTGDAPDLVTFRSELSADYVDETVLISAGLGGDVVTMDVADPQACFIVADYGIDLGAGNDFAFVQLNSTADDLALALAIAGQEGTDVILVQVNHPVPCFLTADIELAGGADGDFIGFFMSVATQPQQEQVVLDVNVELSGGEGDDDVGGTIQAGPATGVVNAIVSGDDGNDRLGLFAELSQLLQSSLIVDGGAGFDSCFASQNVAILNCEA